MDRDRAALLGVVVLVALAGCGYSLGPDTPTETETTATGTPSTVSERTTVTATPTTDEYTRGPRTTLAERTTVFTLTVDPDLGWEPPYTIEFQHTGLVYVTAWGDAVRENESFKPPLEDRTRYRIRVTDAANNTRVIGAIRYRRDAGQIDLTIG